MVMSRKRKLANKILKQNNKATTTPNINWVEQIITATAKAVTKELLEESTDANFGDSDRGENYLSAVPNSTIIRIRDEWAGV